MSAAATPQDIINEYIAAYSAANPEGQQLSITYDRGWYTVRSNRSAGMSSKYRRWQLQRFTKTLLHRVSAVPEHIGR